jgi:glucose/arabinose dehydrogenase
MSSRKIVGIEILESRRLLTVVAGFTETLMAGGMTRPVQMDFAPDGRLFITQQDGKLRVFKNSQLLSTPFVTVSTQNTGERGLIGITFDPNFNTNHYLYVYYTHPDGTGNYRNRVSRFTANGDVAVAGSEKVLIETDPLVGEWHNSGGLRFGLDGKLYADIGDNERTTIAQGLDSLFGKVIRINSDGTIPTDNPFYSTASGKQRAIWAYGFRNPFTLDVQPGTGRIFINDVGSAFWEEINELKKGANYGWPNAEGMSNNPAYTNPFYTYAHAGTANDDSAITGAAFYNPANATFPSSYYGDYFFGDYGTGYIKSIDLNTKAVTTLASGESEITDVEVSDDGSLYFLSRTSGQLFRITPTASSKPTITVPPQDLTVAVGMPATFDVTAGGANLTYQWQRNHANISGATSSSYTLDPTQLNDSGETFRVVVTNSSGSVTSADATLTVLNDKAPTATITLPTDDTLWVGGGTINYAGTGTDPEDGNLPASAFTWSIDLHHDTHTHPFVAPYSGATSGAAQVSTSNHDGEYNLFYRITLTVKDSMGVSSTTFRDVYPQLTNLSLATDPPGLSLNLDGVPQATSYSSPAIVGLVRTLNAPATATLNGVTYAFDSRSDSGAITHDVTIPATDVAVTAKYKVSTETTTTLRATADAYVRDGSFAAQNFGSATDLQAKAGASGWTRWSYLAFNVGGVGADVSSAKLRVFGKLDNTQAASVLASAFSAPTSWGESSINWNNKPAPGGSALQNFTVTGTTAKWYEIDLTNYVKQQKSLGATAVGFAIKAAASNSTVVLNSDEAGSNQPQLVVVTGGAIVPGPSSLRATADGYVRDGSYASTNFGSATELQVKSNATAGYSRETYLKFDLSTLSTIGSAKLRLYGHLTESASLQTAVYGASDTSWSEGGLTWNTKPAVGTTAAAIVTISSTSDQWYEWDVTSLLQAEKAAGHTLVTLVLKNLQKTNATLAFASDEASSNRPELLIT